MEENKKLTDRNDVPLGTRDWGKTPAGAGLQHPQHQKEEQPVRDESRADMNGKKGRFESEKLEETGTPSALPGAEAEGKVGDAASGAGIGGNAGRGTRNKKDFT